MPRLTLKQAEGLLEYRVNNEELEQYAAGAELKVDMFEAGQKVDVTGTRMVKVLLAR